MTTKLHVSPPLSEIELRRRARNVALAVLCGAHSDTDPDLLATLAEDDEFPDPPHYFDPAAWPIRDAALEETDPLAAVPEPPPPLPWESEMLSKSEREEVRALFERERRERMRA